MMRFRVTVAIINVSAHVVAIVSGSFNVHACTCTKQTNQAAIHRSSIAFICIAGTIAIATYACCD